MYDATEFLQGEVELVLFAGGAEVISTPEFEVSASEIAKDILPSPGRNLSGVVRLAPSPGLTSPRSLIAAQMLKIAPELLETCRTAHQLPISFIRRAEAPRRPARAG